MRNVPSFRRYNEDVVIVLKQKAGFWDARVLRLPKQKRKTLKIGLPKSTQISYSCSAVRRKQSVWRFGRVPAGGGKKMGTVHQSGDSAVNKTIRPLPSNGSARSIISAGPGDSTEMLLLMALYTRLISRLTQRV